MSSDLSSSTADAGNRALDGDARFERALREVALASARGELDEAGLARLVASRVAELVGSVTSAVIRRDADCLRVVGYAGPAPCPVRLRLDASSSSGEAVRSGRVARVERRGPPEHPVGGLTAAQRFTCGVSVPVLIDGAVWGCITVTTGRAGGFSTEEEGWLKRFGEFISAALANAEAQARLLGEARLERALREVAAVSSSAQVDVPAVCAVVAERVLELLGAHSAAVYRFDRSAMTTLGAAGSPTVVSLPWGEPTVAGEVARTGRPVLISDYSTLGGEVATRLATAGVGCGAAAPIRLHGRVWGCIGAGGKETGEFTDETLHLLERFAELVSLAVASATAQERLAFRARLEETLREIGLASSVGELDERALGRLVTERVRDLLGARTTSLVRFDPDCITTLAYTGSGSLPERVQLDAPYPVAEVRRTGRTTRRIRPDDPRIGATARDGVQYAISVPVLVSGKPWGAITAGRAEPERFPEEYEHALERLAGLLDAALANSQAQARLRLSEERYRMVTTISSDGIADDDIRTGETWWSPQLLATLDYNDDTFGGSYDWVLEHVVHPQDRRRLAAVLIGGEDLPTTLLRMRDAHGEYHTMVLRSALERDENRNVIRRVSSFTDVTEREQAEAERVALARQLHESVIDDLASTRARLAAATPLSREDPQTWAKTLAALAARVAYAEDTMRHIARALLSDTTLLEARGSISALTDTLASELRRRDPTLQVNVTDMLGPDLQAGQTANGVYAHVLREALLNVLQHAEASRVSITVAEGDRGVRLEVTDDGIGCDPRQHREAALAQRMQDRARVAHGTFKLASTPGQGTTITLELPQQ